MKLNQILLVFFAIIKFNISIDDCITYLDDDYCITCEDGYGLKENGQCSECTSDEIWYQNHCYIPIENCDEYLIYEEGEKCLNCEDGYELNEEQTQCKACKNGYTSHGDTCFKEIEYCEKYEDEEKTCSRCEEGYELYQNGLQCIEKCESDSQIKPFDECIDQIENCEVYKQDKTCEKCSDYFKLDNNKCVYCEDKIGDGKKCYDRIDGCIEQKENKCKKCNINYKISEDGTQCIKCPDNQISGGVTKQCYQFDNCKYCHNGDCTICEQCNDGYSLTNNGNKCESCGEKLSKGFNCFNAIENCNSYFEDGSCKTCQSGYNRALSYLQCTTCESGEFSNSNNKCVSETFNCVQYSSDDKCLQCKNGYKIFNNQCAPCNPPYYWGDGKTCYYKRLNCEKQDVSGNCIECSEGYDLNGNGCVKSKDLNYLVLSIGIISFLLIILFIIFMIKK